MHWIFISNVLCVGLCVLAPTRHSRQRDRLLLATESARLQHFHRKYSTLITHREQTGLKSVSFCISLMQILYLKQPPIHLHPSARFRIITRCQWTRLIPFVLRERFVLLGTPNMQHCHKLVQRTVNTFSGWLSLEHFHLWPCLAVVYDFALIRKLQVVTLYTVAYQKTFG